MKLLDPLDARVPVTVPYIEAHSRYRDRNTTGDRARGIGLTLLLYAGALAGLLVQFGMPLAPPPQPPAPLAVELLPLAAPPEPVHDVKEGPEQVEQPEKQQVTPQPETPPVATAPALAAAKPAEPVEAAARPPVPETTAPKSLPAPPAPAVSSDARDSWEARLLAHLERYRRFPSDARARREEGVVNVRFRMSRNGRVLAARVLRSSGSVTLDRAAMETLRRAQPLPAIPAGLPDEIELELPVAFFLR